MDVAKSKQDKQVGESELVSIVMPSFNSRRYIRDAIASVSRQSYRNWELIVSDDGSTDGTIAAVEEIANEDPRVRLITSASNRGAAKARNAGIAAASGRFIAFLDSDDMWKPEKLEKQIPFMLENDIAFSFSSYDRVNAAGDFIDVMHARKPISYHDLLGKPAIGCLTAVYDVAKFGRVFMPDIPKRQDFALWLKLLKQCDMAHPVAESLAIYRVRDDSLSANKMEAAKYVWKVYRDVEAIDLPTSLYYFTSYMLRGVYVSYLRRTVERIRN